MEDAFLPLTPEILVPRLGEYLVENQYISTGDLEMALERQKTIRERQSSAPLLGQLLVSMGKISQEQLDHAITELILQFRHALENTNQILEQRVSDRTAQLQDALIKLAEANTEKNNFVANISHELRTPLTHIKGYADLLDEDVRKNLTAEQHDMIQVIKRASDRLEKLIDDLILYSSAQKNQLMIVYSDFSITELCSQLIARFQPAAMRKNITLLAGFGQNKLTVSADMGKISWAIAQLLENALKFTPSGGNIRLKVTAASGTVLVCVEDTGIGIPEERLKEIFEPFHQLDGSMARNFGGTGLGLALVKRIVESHHSELEVSSIPGKGSSFGFRLKNA